MDKYKSFFVIFLLIVNFHTLLSNETQNKGEINGVVISGMNKTPVFGVIITVEGTQYGAKTGTNGKFSIKNLPAGEYSVKFSSFLFDTYIMPNVIVTNVKPVQLEITLNEKMTLADSVVVTSSYFERNIETISGSRILSSEDIRRAPGVQEDVVRAASLLPGVAVAMAGRNDLVVRGGAPFENLFIIDNLEVPNINHFGTQGTGGGPLSIINIDFIRSVNFSSGAFGAKFGDKTSSITNIQLRNGNQDKFGGKAFLSATGFGLNLEGPMYEGSSYFISVRRSYLDFFFKAAGFGFIPEYWDFQGKFNFRIDADNSISFIAIGALGSVKLNNDDEDKIYSNSRVAVPNQNQYFSGITWKHITEKGLLNVTLGETYTKYSTFQNNSDNPPVRVFYNYSKEAESILRTDYEMHLMPKLFISVGNQLKWATSLNYDILIPGYLRKDQNGIPQTLSIDTSFRNYKNASYLSLTGSVDKFKLTAGIRAEYYDYLMNKWYFSPRASILYQYKSISAITLSAGRYYQSPSYIWMLGDVNINKNLSPIESDQISVGFDHNPIEDIKVMTEAFYKVYNSYPARIYRPQSVLAPAGFDDAVSDIPYGLEPLTGTGTGYSRGIEFSIQKKLSKIPIYGLLSLTLSESIFKSLDGAERPGAYDTRFMGNIAVGYKINPEWEVSSKFRISTGMPTTPFLPDGQKNYKEYNLGERLPLFHALDIRIDKRWNFSSIYLITYLDIQNIYARKNIQGYKWNYQKQIAEPMKTIGILPSLGITIEF